MYVFEIINKDPPENSSSVIDRNSQHAACLEIMTIWESVTIGFASPVTHERGKNSVTFDLEVVLSKTQQKALPRRLLVRHVPIASSNLQDT